MSKLRKTLLSGWWNYNNKFQQLDSDVKIYKYVIFLKKLSAFNLLMGVILI